jgi:purine-binding chemotaxis protein CheW
MAEVKEYVVFKIAKEFYGIDIKYVENIEKPQLITRVPYAEDYIKGVINLRGNVIPVVDVRKRFLLEDKEITNDSRIIVISYESDRIGLIVDSSSEVVQFESNVIEKAPKIGDSVKDDFVKEVGKEKNRIIMLLDIKKILKINDQENA